MKVTPTGFVPNEDTGTIMGTVDLAPGTSQDRTEVILAQVDSLIGSNDAIESHTQISGYNFISGQGSNYGSFICSTVLRTSYDSRLQCYQRFLA